jgi:hypothetical protein
MKLELEQRLIKAYSGLYRDVSKLPSESLMCFGFECGDGWFNILDRLSKALTDLDEDVVAVQVKEKYGTLRFYITGGSIIADNLIDRAEIESARTCEACGESGKMRNVGHWLRTLCIEHYVEWVLKKLEV